MPITREEASVIKGIVNKYISEEDAGNLFNDLVDNVASTTDNDSVKQSIVMLNQLYNE